MYVKAIHPPISSFAPMTEQENAIKTNEAYIENHAVRMGGRASRSADTVFEMQVAAAGGITCVKAIQRHTSWRECKGPPLSSDRSMNEEIYTDTWEAHLAPEYSTMRHGKGAWIQSSAQAYEKTGTRTSHAGDLCAGGRVTGISTAINK